MTTYYWHKGDKYENVWMRLAWWLPKPLVYWAAIRLLSYATVDKYDDTVVSELTAMDALKRWEDA